MLGEDDEQGRLFSMTDIAYSILSLVLQYIVLAIITYALADDPNGFKVAYIIYGSLSLAYRYCHIFSAAEYGI